MKIDYNNDTKTMTATAENYGDMIDLIKLTIKTVNGIAVKIPITMDNGNGHRKYKRQYRSKKTLCSVCGKKCKGAIGLRMHTIRSHKGNTWSTRTLDAADGTEI